MILVWMYDKADHSWVRPEPGLIEYSEIEILFFKDPRTRNSVK